ncbi:MAG: thermonuclease family protein [Elusimicrobiota bacterium]
MKPFEKELKKLSPDNFIGGSSLQNTCRTVSIEDGDTVFLKCAWLKNTRGWDRVRFEFRDIDAPEVIDNEEARAQAKRLGIPLETLIELGGKSKAYVESKLPLKQKVRLVGFSTTDKTNPTLSGYLWLEKEKANLNLLMVRDGQAMAKIDRAYSGNGSRAPEIRKAARRAKEAGRGIWAVVD